VLIIPSSWDSQQSVIYTPSAPVLVLWLVGGLGFANTIGGGVTTATRTSACRGRWAGMGDEGCVGGVGGRVRLLLLLHEKHALSKKEGGQRVRHGDDGGGRSELRTEAA
jgi:hypothetical protein